MSDKSLHVLNELLEVTRDGEEGFERAMAEVDDYSVKQLLKDCAVSCHSSARELEDKVQHLGGQPEKSGSVAGAIHRGWVNLKAEVTGHDTKAVLIECERGEDYAKSRYKKALAEDELLPDVRWLIQNQYHGVIANQDRIKTLRDQYAGR